MAELWQTILKDEQIIKLHKDINNHINYVIDHGMLHTLNVLKYVDVICKVIGANTKTKELTKIAAVLHDSGRLQSRKEHTKYSSIYSREYLKNKLNEQDLETVCYAIEHHDREIFDYNSKNDVAWILIMADKMDYTRDRYILSLLEEQHKEKLSYNIKAINLTKIDEQNCKIEFELFKDIVNFEQDFANIQIYKSVMNHFGFNLKIKIKVI